jgi:hypothetical protein
VLLRFLSCLEALPLHRPSHKPRGGCKPGLVGVLSHHSRLTRCLSPHARLAASAPRARTRTMPAWLMRTSRTDGGEDSYTHAPPTNPARQNRRAARRLSMASTIFTLHPGKANKETGESSPRRMPAPLNIARFVIYGTCTAHCDIVMSANAYSYSTRAHLVDHCTCHCRSLAWHPAVVRTHCLRALCHFCFDRQPTYLHCFVRFLVIQKFHGAYQSFSTRLGFSLWKRHASPISTRIELGCLGLAGTLWIALGAFMVSSDASLAEVECYASEEDTSPIDVPGC